MNDVIDYVQYLKKQSRNDASGFHREAVAINDNLLENKGITTTQRRNILINFNQI